MVKYVSESESRDDGGAHPGSWPFDLSGATRLIGDKLRVALNEEAGGLLDLQSSLVKHYFRLQEAAQGLSIRAESLQPGTGGGAIRQIELERQRLGREMHTGLGQLLAAIPARKIATRGRRSIDRDIGNPLIILFYNSMQVLHLVITVLGTYRDCGVAKMLAF